MSVTKLMGTKYELGPSFAVSAQGRIRLNDAVSVKDFGAQGDGVADDTAAIQAAINAAGGGDVVFQAGATHRITSALDVSTSGLRLLGNGATLDGSGIAAATALSQRFALNISGSIGSVVSVTADIVEGAVTVAVTSTAGLSAGDCVLLYSAAEMFPAGTSGTNFIGAIHRIRSVDSSTQITLFDGAFFSYAAASQANIRRITPISNVLIEGLTIRMGGANKAHCGIQVVYAERCAVRRCTVYDTEDTAVLMHYALDCETADCDLYNCTSPADGTSGVTGITGYGACAGTATRNVRVLRNRFRNCRHAVAGGGLYTSIAVLVQGNVVAGNRSASLTASAALDCHEDCLYWVFDSNHVSSNNAATGTQGILIRGTGARVTNNVITASANYGIYVKNFDTSTQSRGTVISGNVITRPRLDGIVVEGSAGAPQYELIITDNQIVNPGGEGIVLFGSSNATVANNVVRAPTAANKSGIRLVGSAATLGNRCANVCVSGNVVDTATAYGIRADYGDSLTISGNQIAASVSHSIYLANCNEVAVTGNRLATTSATTSGVFLNASTRVAVVGCSGENTATATSQSSGVQITGASEDIAVSGCVFAFYRYGVYSASPANYIAVSGVNGRNCTVSAVEISASANTAVSANL